MAQFTVYSSSDASGPGNIQGQAGEVLRILDACLVNGYTGKTAAGWTKPIANASNAGCYKQGAGSQFILYINDATPDGSALGKEAWATGWKTLSAVTTPVGVGTGQFPTGAQLLTNGHVVIRKSTTNDTTGRSWVILADNRTFYFFIKTNDVAANYYDFAFGDFFSMGGSADTNRTFICGRSAANDGNSTLQQGGLDRQYNPLTTASFQGLYFADSMSGTTGSQVGYQAGDLAKVSTLLATGFPVALTGALPTPNPLDNAYYLSPIWLSDSSYTVRGRFRGLYQICHPTSNFADGQTFAGANDYAGKSFLLVVKAMFGGVYCLETSNTLDTN